MAVGSSGGLKEQRVKTTEEAVLLAGECLVNTGVIYVAVLLRLLLIAKMVALVMETGRDVYLL